jgi:sulfide:quinone oxidoreductase
MSDVVAAISQRIVILGGGVGGTIVANQLARKVGRRPGVEITIVDQTGQHVYQPGFMYITFGNERAAQLARPERGLVDERVTVVVGEVTRVDEKKRAVQLADGRLLEYDYLVLATGSRIVPEEVPHFAEEAHHFYTAEAATRLRQALDAFTGGKIVVAIAGMPYKCPPAPLEVSFLIEAELRQRALREKSEVHFCSPIGRAFTIETVSDMATPIFEEKGIELHTFFNVEAIDPERKVVQSLEGEELPYDLLVLVPPHKGAQFLIDSGLAPAPGGWLPTDRATLQVGGRPNVYALGDATDLPLSKAGSTAHFEAPVVAERIAAAVLGREPKAKEATYTGQVMCFFEIGDGKGTLLRFDYNHPPHPPKPNRIWHLGKLAFNKAYWLTVPRGRV